MANPKPTRLTYPFITLTTQDAVPVTAELTCYCKGIHLAPEDDDASATFCDPTGYLWNLTLDLLQSVGTEGLDDLLWSLGGPGTLCDFDFAYVNDGAPTAVATNPHWTGVVRLSAWPVVDAGIDEVTEFEWELAVVGEWVRDPAPTTPATAAARELETV